MSEIVRLEIKMTSGNMFVIGVEGSDPDQTLREFLAGIEKEKWVQTSQSDGTPVAFPVDKIAHIFASRH
ncbi:UNVERIFIED_ORG: hypothetical protein EDC92_12161 [Dietzia maris]|uniref:hypothetical protein n=1 Tax=Dietzia TaxID=37914 RepID=UPI000BDEB53A|nr:MULTISPECIES: hypothetical protein [unclassified Dietzia]MCY1656014.1 hypothetical protein [Dietzia sp. SL131]